MKNREKYTEGGAKEVKTMVGDLSRILNTMKFPTLSEDQGEIDNQAADIISVLKAQRKQYTDPTKKTLDGEPQEKHTASEFGHWKD